MGYFIVEQQGAIRWRMRKKTRVVIATDGIERKFVTRHKRGRTCAAPPPIPPNVRAALRCAEKVGNVYDPREAQRLRMVIR